MGGYSRQKSVGFFNIFKTTRPRRGSDASGADDLVKAYKVYPSDEDTGRWVADSGIDRKASAYITTVQENWKRVAVSN